MIFSYKALDTDGNEKSGTIDAINDDIAIRSLQQRGLVISSIKAVKEEGALGKSFTFGGGVSNKDLVILSRQVATLFEAQVSALRVFRLLAEETEKPALRYALLEVSNDLQGGSAISKALEKHPKIFSLFYVNMVRAGEESGKLDQTFLYLADYLDRMYEVTSKARNALIYPAFVISVFLVVMALMFTTVIPKLSTILEDSGQAIPAYTKVVIGISSFMVNYGIFFVILLALGGVWLWRYMNTPAGDIALSRVKISVPYIGTLYRKLYLSRIADNMNTMLSSGIPMLRGLEISSVVVGNSLYENLLKEAVESVRGGSSVADAMSGSELIPNIMTQMIRIGEETGELAGILKTLAHFYEREVKNAVDTLVDLIEPAMIVLLGLGVGTLLASVLIPIYNISAGM
ncbi:type II secretion system F family protein [Candidatus Campbellbacteria bacterium]|nr:MAG: type II secretion system F family protein [Candidatus Campbellbacteria bacterium]